MRQIWCGALAPKLRSFLWLLVQRALPTWERRPEWLLEQGIAACRLCKGVPNSLVHVLATCARVEAIWCLYAEWMTVRLERRINLATRFILLGMAGSESEENWRKQSGGES